MDKQRLHGVIGLSQRAGKCIAGDYAVERAIKSGKAKYILLDCSASLATRQRFQGFCQRGNIPYVEMEDLGRAIGKPGNRIVAVTDGNFAGMIGAAAYAAEENPD